MLLHPSLDLLDLDPRLGLGLGLDLALDLTYTTRTRSHPHAAAAVGTILLHHRMPTTAL